jgi:hypothetical protein
MEEMDFYFYDETTWNTDGNKLIGMTLLVSFKHHGQPEEEESLEEIKVLASTKNGDMIKCRISNHENDPYVFWARLTNLRFIETIAYNFVPEIVVND